MINTIIINHEQEVSMFIKNKLDTYCPQLNVCGLAKSYNDSLELIKISKPALAFIDMRFSQEENLELLNSHFLLNLETIFIGNAPKMARKAFQYHASGFLLNPIEVPELIDTVNHVKNRIEQKEKLQEQQRIIAQLPNQAPPGNLIGIPTFEGFDFIQVNSIIRCEAMQKCTRIVMTDKTEIISSYNIGEFIKLLKGYDFFSTHKSHLINLIHIKKFYKEGTLKMVDNSFVPVSKRRKRIFLERMLLSR